VAGSFLPCLRRGRGHSQPPALTPSGGRKRQQTYDFGRGRPRLQSGGRAGGIEWVGCSPASRAGVQGMGWMMACAAQQRSQRTDGLRRCFPCARKKLMMASWLQPLFACAWDVSCHESHDCADTMTMGMVESKPL